MHWVAVAVLSSDLKSLPFKHALEGGMLANINGWLPLSPGGEFASPRKVAQTQGRVC